MITREELRSYCNLTGFNLGQAERDYLQHLFLILLSKYSSNELVFKGGTALQKAHGLKRFSIDIDFTQVRDCDVLALMKKISRGIHDLGYSNKFEETKTLGKTFVFRIQGPLYAHTSISSCSLRIEISQREAIILNPELRTINPIYKDLQPYSVLVMNLQEILAEKIRAIMTRNKPRDVFDLHFLLSKGIKFDMVFINKKLSYYKEAYAKERFIIKLKEKKLLWEKEMKNYIVDVPDFEEIIKEIIKKVK